jgi:hypothetical protein
MSPTQALNAWRAQYAKCKSLAARGKPSRREYIVLARLKSQVKQVVHAARMSQSIFA